MTQALIVTYLSESLPPRITEEVTRSLRAHPTTEAPGGIGFGVNWEREGRLMPLVLWWCWKGLPGIDGTSLEFGGIKLNTDGVWALWWEVS
jgi:hypothetical protein